MSDMSPVERKCSHGGCESFVVLLGDVQFSSVPFLRCEVCDGYFCCEHGRFVHYRIKAPVQTREVSGQKSLCLGCVDVVRGIAGGKEPEEASVCVCGSDNCDASMSVYGGRRLHSKFVVHSVKPVELHRVPMLGAWFCDNHVVEQELGVLTFVDQVEVRKDGRFVTHTVRTAGGADTGKLVLTFEQNRSAEAFQARQVEFIFEEARRDVQFGGFEPDDSDTPG